MSAFKAAQVHYEGLQNEATVAARTSLRAAGISLDVMRFNRRAFEALTDQWRDRRVDWDWHEICRKNRGPKSYCIAIWADADCLAGLSLMTVSGEAVTVRYLEGDPRPDCPIKGLRALVALEVATNYAQICGLYEVRIQPLNEALASLYENVYGFELVKRTKECPYYRKRI